MSRSALTRHALQKSLRNLNVPDDPPEEIERRVKQDELSIYGNDTTYNLNTLLHQNILQSAYFHELYKFRTYHEVVDEIYYRVDHAEPWSPGTARIPSSCFCLLHKFFLMRLTRKQMLGLLRHKDSTYIRVVGFLYLRYTCEPEDLWTWFEPYLEDPEEFNASANPSVKTTIGEWLIRLLEENNYFSTILPRIPKKIEDGIKVKLLLLVRKKERGQANAAIVNCLQPGTKVRAMYADEENEPAMYDAIIDSVEEGGQYFWVTFPAYGNSEKVSLGDIEYVPSKSVLRSHSWSRDRSRERYNQSSDRRQRGSRRDRSRTRRQSSSRSRSASRDRCKREQSSHGNERNKFTTRRIFVSWGFYIFPEDLWTWFEPYLEDPEEFNASANPSVKTTIGEWLIRLLEENNYFSTILPRIPKKIEDGIKVKLLLLVRKKERGQANAAIVNCLQPGTKVRAMYADEENEPAMYDAIIDSVEEGGQYFWVTFPAYGNSEKVSLGDIEYVPSKSVLRSHSWSRDRSRERYNQSSDRRQRGSRRDRSRTRRQSSSRSRSASRDRCKREQSSHGNERNKFTDITGDLLQQVRERERRKAEAVGRDYASRPASYKGSLSLKLDRWTSRKRSRSPMKRDEVVVVQPGMSTGDERPSCVTPSREGAEKRLKSLRELYGDASSKPKLE
ncbi:hypothetical protein CCR75_003647 [Bremia lactucae]|uniref:Tudor domain-containing protein n=1 Tax=Bremia lactucae TaxID=4779 RepID=A0A976IKW6_BRELC|nr:hypothetical protein CCR75_003647 [Bremia lactucae]